MNIILDKLSNVELVKLYSEIIRLLKVRKIIRSQNVTGDLGEYMAIDHYNKTKRLPKLQPAPQGTKNIDAISIDGERYSIKTITNKNKTTGVFYGLNSPGSTEEEEQKFEYVLIVVLGDNLELNKIIQITWNQFLEYKKWHSRVRAWNLTINSSLLENASIVYNAE